MNLKQNVSINIQCKENTYSNQASDRSENQQSLIFLNKHRLCNRTILNAISTQSEVSQVSFVAMHLLQDLFSYT